MVLLQSFDLSDVISKVLFYKSTTIVLIDHRNDVKMFNTLQRNHSSRNFSKSRLRKEEENKLRLFHDLYFSSTIALDQSAREEITQLL